MKNLAGDPDCDRYISEELQVCRITQKKLDERSQSEVPSSIVGELGPFTFKRAWYYYIATGPMPLCAAVEMYDDPLGRRDVRVDGRGNNVEPISRARTHWTSDGRPYPIIDSYHIDSEAGLRLFADVIRARGLDKSAPEITPWNDEATNDIVRHFEERPTDLGSMIGQIILRQRRVYAEVNWDDPRIVDLTNRISAAREAVAQ